MIIGVSEGDSLTFEVVLMSDGFIVRARRQSDGGIEPALDRLFRTASAAFAYAQMSALKDAEGATGRTGLKRLEVKMQSDRAARVFDEIRDRLDDEGVSAGLLHAWDAIAAAPRLPAMH